VLCWDFATIYAMERELLSQLKMDWLVHDRLHFRYDDNHPPAASLHEKIVVIDDQVAFIGGIDLGPRRWDTSGHLPDDDRRVGPSGSRYRPFHDVQAVVQGEIAKELGEFARDRWARTAGERLGSSRGHGDPWPADVTADIEDLTIALVRTRPDHASEDPMSHTLHFHERLFAVAENHVFIENQFLTSDEICAALVRALDATDAPEVLLITAKENSGWLETAVMGGLRTSFCRRLREADRRGRLRICYPEIVDGVWPNVHSKLTIVDDCWAYLGSANFSNRSMGLDTECGLGIDGSEREDIRAALCDLRIRLISEHLGVTPAIFESKERELGMLAAVDTLRGAGRTLRILETEDEEVAGIMEPVARVADPKKPIRVADLIDDFF
jgi:phosphatidylserine/phosphatidylglycerophosphate/cardiolipin synthase-like enzyme